MRIFLCWLTVLCLGSKVWASEPDCRVLYASGNAEYPPYLWHLQSQPNHLEGALAQLLQDLSFDLKIPIKAVYAGPWGRVQEEASAGRLDLVAGVFFTRQRSRYLDYIYPAMAHTQTRVWMHGDSPSPSSWSDLKPWRGITVTNNSFGEQFDRFANAHLHISEVASLEQAIRMLVAKRADYLVYEYQPAKTHIERLGLMDLRPQPLEIAQENLYLGFSKASACNTPQLRQQLGQLLQQYQHQRRLAPYLEHARARWRKQHQPAVHNAHDQY